MITGSTVNCPLVPVKLAVPKELSCTAPPIDTYARIETGFPYTLIQEGVATDLGLTPFRKAAISTATKYIQYCDVYRVRIEFGGGYAVQIEAIEVPYLVNGGESKVKCALGCGFLDVCKFTYDGPANTFTLDFQF
jgi:predicted aspartyl protease